ncbi:MAG: CapA family protein [Pseudonocardia sp.]
MRSAARLLGAGAAVMVIAAGTAAVSPASAAVSGSPPAPPPRTSITVVVTGDVLIHQGRLAREAAAAGRASGVGFDFGPIFAPVAPLIQAADLALCHLETPLATPEGPFRGYPVFSTQPQIVDALIGAGYDACSTASNHSLDSGFAGLVRTLDTMDGKGLVHTGTFRSAQESLSPRTIDVDGVTVGHVAWTYGLNGIPLPAGKEWAVNVSDLARMEVDRLLAAAARARQAGADVVIASVHCCVEYRHDPTPAQVAIAAALLASPDVDLMLGHHAHVVQPFERIDGKWVAYGLGNHIAGQGAGETEDSVIGRFTFTRGPDGRFAVTRAEAIPTRIDLRDGPVRIVDTAARREVHADSFDRVVEILNRRGAAAAGLLIAAQ